MFILETNMCFNFITCNKVGRKISNKWSYYWPQKQIGFFEQFSSFSLIYGKFEICCGCTGLQSVLRMIFWGHAWITWVILLWLNPLSYYEWNTQITYSIVFFFYYQMLNRFFLVQTRCFAFRCCVDVSKY